MCDALLYPTTGDLGSAWSSSPCLGHCWHQPLSSWEGGWCVRHEAEQDPGLEQREEQDWELGENKPPGASHNSQGFKIVTFREKCFKKENEHMQILLPHGLRILSFLKHTLHVHFRTTGIVLLGHNDYTQNFRFQREHIVEPPQLYHPSAAARPGLRAKRGKKKQL